jgi:hypothetical protein
VTRSLTHAPPIFTHTHTHLCTRRAAAADFARRNIFVPDSLLGFYDLFVAADIDRNGMVSEEEMAVRSVIAYIPRMRRTAAA